MTQINRKIDQLRKCFNAAELEGISKIIGDTNHGLTGSEITYVFSECTIEDVDSINTKWRRIFNALVNAQNKTQRGNTVLKFVSKCLAPARHFNDPDRYRGLISGINKVLLLYDNMEFRETGKFHKYGSSTTFSQAIERASLFREKLKSRNVHSTLIEGCAAEIADDNYFHAVLEACKLINSKVRLLCGIDYDGSELYDKAFGGENPQLKINSYISKNEIGEQRGFVNMAKGLMGVFRNPHAHSPRSEWIITVEDALDLFSMASYVLRRIENSK
ncbi:MAG: TIGR02391 family protein [Bacillota bacterium]